ncbi:hypothetical protein RFI_00900 [Reticulomyxa filosa]|uniref:Uncharacterized protein n=1 Tax=Reticulomyxa filosa TaxID=46433 RepID=X6PDH8_RETFI|nr:hypothetical protein RFI_00900 [Reticulomyxa filosa]|eukprot:ETO36163.1 hypothetical protein RFI_00900 [Reticulomyxa filosa]
MWFVNALKPPYKKGRPKPSIVKTSPTDKNTEFWNDLYREGNIANIVGRNYDTVITKEDAILILCNYLHVSENYIDTNHPLIGLLSNQSIRFLRHKIQTDNEFFETVRQYLGQLNEKYYIYSYSNFDECCDKSTKVENDKAHNSFYPAQSQYQSQLPSQRHIHTVSEDAFEFVDPETMYEQEEWAFDDQRFVTSVIRLSTNFLQPKKKNYFSCFPPSFFNFYLNQGFKPIETDADVEKEELVENNDHKEKGEIMEKVNELRSARKKSGHAKMSASGKRKKKQSEIMSEQAFEESIILTPMASLKLALDAQSNSEHSETSPQVRQQTLSISVTSENGTVFQLVPFNDWSSNPLVLSSTPPNK